MTNKLETNLEKIHFTCDNFWSLPVIPTYFYLNLLKQKTYRIEVVNGVLMWSVRHIKAQKKEYEE